MLIDILTRRFNFLRGRLRNADKVSSLLASSKTALANKNLNRHSFGIFQTASQAYFCEERLKTLTSFSVRDVKEYALEGVDPMTEKDLNRFGGLVMV